MAYLQSSGSRDFGDIDYEDDTNTQIDFEEDYIGLKTGGASVLVVSGSNVGIGTTTPDANELLTLDGVDGDHECNIQLREDGTNRAKIGINDSNNLVLHNQTTNKHIVFKVNDAGTTREGIRINGAVPEVVVNEGSDALVDFRVESDNQTHMLFVDGANDKVGIGTDAPDYTLDVAGNIGVDQYIYHNGDADTWIRFNDDDITIKAGGKAFLTLEEKGSAPHEITFNDGANNIDTVIKGNGSGAGNPLLKCDADTNRVGINGVGSPGSGLHVDSSFATAIAAKSSDYTLTAGDHTILVDCSNGNVTLTLPTAVGCAGRIYIIKRVDGTNNAANINSDGSEEIEGSTNPASVSAMSSIMIQSDNSGWWKVAEYINVP